MMNNDSSVLKLLKTGSIMMPMKAAALSALGNKQTYFSVQNSTISSSKSPVFKDGHCFLPQNDNQHSQYVEAKVWQLGLPQEVINRGDRADNFCAHLPLILKQKETKEIIELSDEELLSAGYAPRIGRLQLSQQNGNPKPINDAVATFVQNNTNLSAEQAPMMAEMVKAALGLDAANVQADEQAQQAAKSLAQGFMQQGAETLDTLVTGSVRSYSLGIASAEQLVALGECETPAEATQKIGKAYRAIAAEALRPMSIDPAEFRYNLEHIVENADEKLRELKERGETMMEASKQTPKTTDVSAEELEGSISLASSITAAR